MQTVKIPEILLPADNCDMEAWAVNACDQYTSDYLYWENVEKSVKGKPSAYNLVFPEIYLNDKPEERIARINETMRGYLSGGIFKKVSGGFILVERTTQSGTRTGIVLAVDLEDYSFKIGEHALIRSTEATILERIPPRMKIRQNAPIELPHVMLLYDDEKNSVINSIKRGKVLYDFDLMLGGGHVKGTYIENSEKVTEVLYSLCSSELAEKKYGKDEKLLFAVGDGNHSLATAKACWDNLKHSLGAEELKTHPARFALVEAVNIYDAALKFEPIHRFVKTDKTDLFVSGLKTSGAGCAYTVIKGQKHKIGFDTNIANGIKELDAYIADFIESNGGEVDYIHGEEDLTALTSNGGAGVILPAIKKDDFFRLIVSGGNLPKKTFSMGEGYEKRYYIEAKRIKKD
ncbi:MAG: DUF1015 domain-containing protein [Clostridia bacterium]|nr:DUF1015 domain-containing protein [Clostridia bacterium]